MKNSLVFFLVAVCLIGAVFGASLAVEEPTKIDASLQSDTNATVAVLTPMSDSSVETVAADSSQDDSPVKTAATDASTVTVITARKEPASVHNRRVRQIGYGAAGSGLQSQLSGISSGYGYGYNNAVGMGGLGAYGGANYAGFPSFLGR
ncbi:hypothetical protein BV898_06909 [Hypsibius exemplaris]|uniref:Uncharacterized protein n=1 Tax=Hypsibius exemplaris TaxID=2072580 RepID=A0A1W0WV26_HYPEX|nr:hypothetical protein BV898_06909 [Hypsibius exemplaris]